MIRRAISTASSPSPGAEKNSKRPSFSPIALRFRGKQELPEMFQRIGSGRAGARPYFSEFSLQDLGRLRCQTLEELPVSARLQVGIQAGQGQPDPRVRARWSRPPWRAPASPGDPPAIALPARPGTAPAGVPDRLRGPRRTEAVPARPGLAAVPRWSGPRLWRIREARLPGENMQVRAAPAPFARSWRPRPRGPVCLGEPGPSPPWPTGPVRWPLGPG